MYFELKTQRFSKFWSLNETVQLRAALGIQGDGESISESLSETVEPTEIKQPLTLHVDGTRPSSVLVRSRGFGLKSTCDLIADDAFLAVLSDFAIPEHEAIRCTVRGQSFTWLWWTEFLEAKIDFAKSTIFLADSAGSEAVDIADAEAYMMLRKEAVNQMKRVLLRDIVWTDAHVDSLDLLPIRRGTILVSKELAASLRASNLAGFEVVD